MTRWSLLLAAVCLALAGCGDSEEPRYQVSGMVLRDGQPVVVEDFYEGVNCLYVHFALVDEQGNLQTEGVNSFSQDVAEDGSFELTGAEGDGIPGGKYRVGVTHVNEEDPEVDIEDMFNGQYTADKSPFEFDVSSDQSGLVIDLAKFGGAQ